MNISLVNKYGGIGVAMLFLCASLIPMVTANRPAAPVDVKLQSDRRIPTLQHPMLHHSQPFDDAAWQAVVFSQTDLRDNQPSVRGHNRPNFPPPPTCPVINNRTHEGFGTIQAAIDAVNTTVGDLIFVNGTEAPYQENIVVNKSLAFQGRNASYGIPIIDGSGSTAWSLTAPNVTIDGFNITNASCGVACLEESAGFTLTNNTFWHDAFGVCYAVSKTAFTENLTAYDIMIADNEFTMNSSNISIFIGISLDYAGNDGYTILIGDITITNNTILNEDSSAMGITVAPISVTNLTDGSITVDDITITNNTVTNGLWGVMSAGAVNDLDTVSLTAHNLTISGNTLTNQTTYGIAFVNYNGYNWADVTAAFGASDIEHNQINDTPTSLYINYGNLYNYSRETTLTLTGLTVLYNTITNTSLVGIDFQATSIGCELHDNASLILHNLSILNNTIHSTVPGSQGIDTLAEYWGKNMENNASSDIQSFTISGNTITADDYGLAFDHISNIGVNLHDNATMTLGDLSFYHNTINCSQNGIGIYNQDGFNGFGSHLSNATTATIGNIKIDNNTIDSYSDGIYVYSFNEFGYEMTGDARFTMQNLSISGNTIDSYQDGTGIGCGICIYGGVFDLGFNNNNATSVTINDIRINNNQIASAAPSIDINRIIDIGTALGTDNPNASASVTLGNITINHNTLTSADAGISIDGDSNFPSLGYYGDYLHANTTCTIGNIQLDHNTITAATQGLFIYGVGIIGASLSNNSTATIGSLLITNNTINTTTDTGIAITNGFADIATDLTGTSQTTIAGIHLDHNTITATNASSITIGPTTINTTTALTIAHNTITNSTIGINITQLNATTTCHPTIHTNTITNCTTGINLTNSSGNLLYNNYLNNTNNTHDNGNNTWNTTKTPGTNILGHPYLGGNYWADYTGIDQDYDGLGDTLTPYADNGNIHTGGDHHPLTTPHLTAYPPTNLIATTTGTPTITLTWIKGIRADYTLIQRKIGAYPANNTDGTLVYNGTGTTTIDTPLTPGTTYYYRAWGYNSTATTWSTDNTSTTNTTWTIPTTPTDLTATTTGTTTITLTWTKGTNATYTRIQRNTTQYPTDLTDGTTVYNGTASTHPETSLTPGTTYYYRAWSYNTTSNLYSTDNASTCNTTWTIPVTPTSLIATTTGTTQITLTWTVGSNTTYTRIQRATDTYPTNVSNGINVYNGTGTTTIDTSLTPGTTYYYRAWGYNTTSHLWTTDNNSAYNTTWTIPEAPSNFDATTLNTTAISLTWTVGQNTTITRIQRALGAYPTNITNGTMIYNDTGTSLNDTNLANWTTYYYRAWGYNTTSHLWSTTNATASTKTWHPPLPPANLTATTTSPTNVTLTWTTGLYTTITRIQRNTTTYPNNITDGDTVYNGTSTSTADTSLTPGTTYYYRAWGYNTTSHLWTIENSTTQNTTWITPTAPTAFTATAAGTTSITLSWTKGTHATHTRIQCTTGTYPANITSGTTVYNGTAATCSDTSLTAGTTYYYRAWSYNATTRLWSTYSQAHAATQSGGGPGGGGPSGNEAPDADAGGPYHGTENQALTVNGSKSTDDVKVTGYRWDWTNDGTYDTSWSTAPIATHIYTAPGNYTVRLQVKDGENSTNTDTATVTITAATVSPYQPPYAEANGPYHGLSYQDMRFNSTGSRGINAALVNYTWSFGDGTRGFGASPTHAYTDEGTFTVTLTVTDNHSMQASDTAQVTVAPDVNRDNVSDVIEQTIGTIISPDDIHPFQFGGQMYDLIDTDKDGRVDTLYNPATNTKTTLGEQDGKLLVDVNGDGSWDYVYDPALGTATAYQKKETPASIPLWMIIAVIVVILVIVVAVVLMRRSGYI